VAHKTLNGQDHSLISEISSKTLNLNCLKNGKSINSAALMPIPYHALIGNKNVQKVIIVVLTIAPIKNDGRNNPNELDLSRTNINLPKR
jgi:hypothetical protein